MISYVSYVVRNYQDLDTDKFYAINVVLFNTYFFWGDGKVQF